MVALIGPPGTGKTQLAAEIARGFCRILKTVQYVRAQEMFMAIKEAYGPAAVTTELAVVRRFRRPTLLIIDDLHVRAASENEDRLLHLILDYRYGDGQGTVLIANNSPEEFRAQLGDPLYTRLVETGGWKLCEWPSFRTAGGK